MVRHTSRVRQVENPVRFKDLLQELRRVEEVIQEASNDLSRIVSSVLSSGFRSEPEVRERVVSVEVDDELDYLPVVDVE
jgi:hypothetical protein